MTGLDPHAGYGYAADTESDDAGGSHAINWIGAVSSLALVVGLGVWGWQTIQRDVSGIPVIQAISEPMRVRPEDPGGLQSDHQGYSVNEVQSEGRAGDPVEQLVLAPPPLDLITGTVNTTPLAAPSQTASNGSNGIAPLTPDMTPEQQKAALDAMAQALANGATPLAPVTPSVRADSGTISSAVPGVSQSVRPRTRPAGAAPAAAIAVAPTPLPSNDQVASLGAQTGLPPTFVDPATIPAGTRMVQFGAFDSAQIAQAEWVRLSGRFSSFLGDKQPVIQRAISGGREFHRLRVLSFEDVSEARRFCTVFTSDNTACIPVVAK